MARSRWILVVVAVVVLGLLGGGAYAVVRGHADRVAVERATAAASSAAALERTQAEARAEREHRATLAQGAAARAAAQRAAAEKAAAEKAAADKTAADKAAADKAAEEKAAEAAAERSAEKQAEGEWNADTRAAAATAADAEARAAGWYDAASREHCAAPDQVWTADNGHVPSADLAEIPWAPGNRVRADVLGDLVRLDDAFAAAFGRHLSITSAYRTHSQQEALYDPATKVAAPPGCSNHGTGLAVDLGGGVQTFGSAEYDWLKAHAPDYGWVHPPFAEPGGRNPEPWHWQSILAPNSQ